MRVDLDHLLRTGAIPGADGLLSHRLGTIREVARLFARTAPRVLVETGCQSTLLLHDHGMSTTIFGAFAERYDAILHTVDIDTDKIRLCRDLTKEYAAFIRYTIGDSIAFLSSFDATIDFLYLDSYDFDVHCREQSRLHQLGEIEAAWGRLRAGSIVLLDDANVRPWFEGAINGLDVQGKTPYAHRYLLAHGARCLVDYPSYQRLYVVGDRA